MTGRGISRANANRKVRQDALREQLSKQKHVEKVVENLGKLGDLEVGLDSLQIQRLKAANDGHLKLIAKYLPDTKAVEIDLNGSLSVTNLSDEEINERLKELGGE